jgi:hypothetical protein
MATMLGAFLLIQGVFNLNFCLIGNCTIDPSAKKLTKENNTFVYEEVKPNKK